MSQQTQLTPGSASADRHGWLRRQAKRGAVVAAAAAFVGAGLAFGPAAAASAGVVYPCHGGTCNGQDPIADACANDAYTAASVQTSEGFVELRYSPKCAANWARISGSSPGTWFWVQNNSGDAQQYYVPAGNDSGYTNMVDGTPLARAGDLGGYTPWA